MSDPHYPRWMTDGVHVPTGCGLLCPICGDEVKSDFRAYQLALKDGTVKLFCTKEHADLWKAAYPNTVVSV